MSAAADVAAALAAGLAKLSDDQLEPLAARLAELLPAPEPGHQERSPWMTVAETAEYLRITPQGVRDRLGAGRLARHKHGSRVLLSRAEVEAAVLPTAGSRRRR
jgi:excisionase family DNA binding protein